MTGNEKEMAFVCQELKQKMASECQELKKDGFRMSRIEKKISGTE